MKLYFKILIIDDHPMIITGCKLLIENYTGKFNLKTESAENSDTVLHMMNTCKGDFFDLVILDISLPSDKNNIVINGEHLGLRIKQNFPKTKIIVHTALADYQRISNIYKTLNPKGFLIKTDVVDTVLIDAILNVINGDLYYSKNAYCLIKPKGSLYKEIDSLDQKILYYLSLGEKMKNLPKYIPLSIATIERRKKNLAIFFNVTNNSTKQLLDKARSKGFI